MRLEDIVKESSGVVNRPHLAKELVGWIFVAAMLGVGLAAAIVRNPPPLLQGWLLVGIALVAAAAMGWVFRRELQQEACLEVSGDSLAVTSWWDRLRGRPGRHLPLAEIRRIAARRPVHVEIQTDLDSLEVPSEHWGRSKYRELEKLADRLGISFDAGP